jgi:muconate cycloisomerase
MRITSVTLYHFHQAFQVGFASPQFHRTAADSVILALGFDTGVVGYGESAPREYVTGETCVSVTRVLAETAAPCILNRTVERIEDVRACLAEIEALTRTAGGPRPNSALGAVDLALLDALGRQRGAPVTDLLQTPTRASLPLSVSVPLLPLEAVQRLWGLVAGKIPLQALKVLLENDPQANCRRVACIRAMVPPDLELRLEANGKWSRQEAWANLEAVAPYALRAVEEPLRPADREALPELRRRFGRAVVLDESIQQKEDLLRFAAMGGVDVVNIKVSKCGGLLASLDLAREARQRGIEIQVGAHVGESPILSAAGRLLAGALPDLTVYEGCSHLLFANLMQSGACSLPAPEVGRPGLGVADEALQALLQQATLLHRAAG